MKSTTGIIGLLEAYPESGKPLSELAEILLRSPGPIPQSWREIIAVYVSARNGCYFCSHSHAAIAVALGVPEAEISSLLNGQIPSEFEPALQALLEVAELTRELKAIPEDAIAKVLGLGLPPRAIHDAALITAAFCLFNRYVEALSRSPKDPDYYKVIGDRIALEGYR